MTILSKQIGRRPLLRFVVVIALAGCCFGATSEEKTRQQNSQNLFQEVQPQERPKLDEQAKTIHESSEAAKKNYTATVVRADYARLDWNQFTKISKDLNPTTLRLFADLSLEFIPDRFKEIPVSAKLSRKKKRFEWSGKIRVSGKNLGKAVFVVNMTDRTISGTIRYQNKPFRIQPLQNDFYEITELRPEGFPEEANPKKREKQPPKPPKPGGVNLPPDGDQTLPPVPLEGVIPPPNGEQTPAPLPVPMGRELPCSDDAESPIDVMVLYTEEARAASPNIEDEIFEAFIDANETFEGSKVNEIVQPSFIGPLAIPENEQIRNIDDALFKIGDEVTLTGKTVAQLRNESKADLVSLWIERAADCGLGYQADQKDPGELDAFSVVRRDCAVVKLSFIHEMGHNLGLGHDRYSLKAKGNNDRESNYGHVSLKWLRRTVMALNYECLDDSNDVCDRVPSFSNPEIPYPDSSPPDPMGVASEKPDAADNSAVARGTACKIASYR